MPDIDTVWARIEANEGETFCQIRGQRFTYEVHGDHLTPSTTNWNIPKSHFEEGLGLVPLKNTVAVQHLFGPSYIYAILMDHRIRQRDW